MKDQLRSRYQKLQVLLYVFACVILFSAPSIAQTVDCHSTLPWTNYNVYVQGNKAKNNGVQYEAKWWTQNQTPSNDPNGPWLVLGTCSDNTTVQDNCSALANWSTATVYTGGELVVYNGNIFKARNYTQGQTPGSVANPWDLHGMCDPNTLPGGTVITTTPWNLEGNSNATATSFIGTTNNFPLLFKANNVEAMRIATTGAVGVNVPATNGPNNNIYYHKFTVNGPTNLVGNENALSISSPTLSANGTKHYMYFSNLTFPNSTEQYSNIGAYEFLDPNGTIQNGKHLILQAAEASKLGIGFFNAAPTEKLSVNGNGLFTGTLKATSISLTSGAGLGKVLTSDATGLATWQTVDLSAGWSLAGNSNTSTNDFIGTTNNIPFIVRTNNIARVRVDETGVVGIGLIPLPNNSGAFQGNALLQVKGISGNSSPAAFSPIPVSRFTSSNSTGGIELGVLAGNTNTSFIGGGSKLNIYSQELSIFGPYGQTNQSTTGKLYVGGKVSIGDSYIPDGYSLSVNGKIIATELAVKLRNKWPDYVFSKEYKLMSLGEVEQYISIHKHLPGMPTAEEIQTNGMQVGEVNTIMVEKIEELTLYSIQQQKQIEEQEQLNLKLIKLIEEQNERIIRLEQK